MAVKFEPESQLLFRDGAASEHMKHWGANNQLLSYFLLPFYFFPAWLWMQNGSCASSIYLESKARCTARNKNNEKHLDET